MAPAEGTRRISLYEAGRGPSGPVGLVRDISNRKDREATVL